jgi:type IV secretory pathway component VirB8
MGDIRQQIDTEQVHQAVKDGNYFQQSRHWYDELFHRPIAERTFFVVLMALSVITILFSTIAYLSLQPLSRTIPYAIYSQDAGEEIPKIQRLRSKPAEDINLALGRFLLSDYVQQRENYVYDVNKLEWQFNRIRQTSGPAEFARYQTQVNTQNPSSPVMKYGRDGTRDVSFYRYEINLEAQPKTAQLYFTTTVKMNKKVEQKNWVANITFRFPKLTVDQNTVDVLQWNPSQNAYELATQIQFKVERYFVQEIMRN